MIINGVTFWDGGLLNNNPVAQVWQSRHDANTEFDSTTPVSCVVSIGATYADLPSWNPFPKLALLKQASGYLTNTEARHHDFQRFVQDQNFRHKERKLLYFRFNAPTGSESVSLDDVNKMDEIVQYTGNYLAQPRVQDAVLACAHALVRTQRRTFVDVVAPDHLRRSTTDRSQPVNDCLLAPMIRFLVDINDQSRTIAVQTRPFLVENIAQSYISARFLKRLQAAGYDQNARDEDRVTFDVQVFLKSRCMPVQKSAIFEISEIEKDTVGDVVIGRDLMDSALHEDELRCLPYMTVYDRSE